MQAVAPEDAVEEAAELAKTNNLWALVTFDVAGNDTLEPFVKYRIRFGSLPSFCSCPGSGREEGLTIKTKRRAPYWSAAGIRIQTVIVRDNIDSGKSSSLSAC